MKLKDMLEKAKTMKKEKFWCINDLAQNLHLDDLNLKEETKELTEVNISGHYESSRGAFLGFRALFLDDEIIGIYRYWDEDDTAYYWISEEAHKKIYDYVNSLVSHDDIFILAEDDLNEDWGKFPDSNN